MRRLLVGGLLGFSLEILASCGQPVVPINPSSAVLTPGQSIQFQAITSVPNSSPLFQWEVNGVQGGSPSTGTITTAGIYTAPATAPAQPVRVGIREQQGTSMVTIYDPSHPSPGSVVSTQNPLVASYSIAIPSGASVYVQFGLNTTYGLPTSSVSAPTAGGVVTVLVAGMLASTSYHMQAVIQLADGSLAKDSDHTFMTGAIPADVLPNITAEFTGVGTPSPGVELFSLIPTNPGNLLSAVATDLSGNVIWYYNLPGAYPNPIKLLPNGHMLLVTGGSVSDVREVDLAGNIIHQVPIPQIIASVASLASFEGATWQGLNHDILSLPNGHLILLASISRTINNQAGIPDGTTMEGNALIDWDVQQGAATWTWSTFDHLDLTHAPYGLSDWTHGNALLYSPDDGDLIFSLRNQNWILKINYQDGKGDGSVLWRLGPDGDFTLPNGQAPIEWNYGQHYATIQSPNSSGVFSLMFFNNGNNRLVDSNNDVCGSTGVTACYSSVPIFQLNEYDKTATVLWEDKLSPSYSVCCGDALVLPNGNVEFDVAYDVNTPNVSYIEEVTQTQTPDLVWKMNITGQLAYRGFRIPSLYPGQVWTAYAQQNIRKAAVH